MNGHLIGFAAVLLSTLCVGCGGPPEYIAPTVDPLPGNPSAETAHAAINARLGIAPALERAELALRFAEVHGWATADVYAFEPEAPATLSAAARVAYLDGRFDDGRAFFDRAVAGGAPAADVYADHTGLLVDAGQFEMAREIGYAGLLAFPDDAALTAAIDRAIDEDPVLMAPIKTIQPDVDMDVLKALGGGSTVTLKAKLGDENLAAIKPDQDLEQSMYRSEIAYYRLCALVSCSFRVPYNREIRFERRDFEALYARVDSAKQRGYKGKFIHLRWATEDGGEYLHAVWKEWVPAFTGFPVEATAAWTKWLEAGSTRDGTERVLDWLPTLANYAGPRGWARHQRRVDMAGDLEMAALVGQISDQIAVDFLTNNWDRFSGDPELWGANCHFEAGGLVAIDNGASFPPWKTGRVERRLKLVQRFRRELVDGVRRLDHDKTLDRLFPSANKAETQRFEIFWERRQEFLDYVDGLIDVHGAEAVLIGEPDGRPAEAPADSASETPDAPDAS